MSACSWFFKKTLKQKTLGLTVVGLQVMECSNISHKKPICWMDNTFSYSIVQLQHNVEHNDYIFRSFSERSEAIFNAKIWQCYVFRMNASGECNSATSPDFVYKCSSDVDIRLENFWKLDNWLILDSVRFYAWDSWPAGFEFRSGCRALTTIVMFGRKSASYWTQSAATAPIWNQMQEETIYHQ